MATRINYTQDVLNLPDVLSTEAFVLRFNNVPGGGDSRGLTLRCQTCVVPGVENEKIEVNLHGFQMFFRGRRRQSGSMSVTFIETRDSNTTRSLRRWIEFVVGTRSGNSRGYKFAYTTRAELSVFDTTGATADFITIFNCFPANINEIPLDGGASTAMVVTCDFSFDYTVARNNPIN